MKPLELLVIFGVALTVWTDVQHRRIPNALVFGLSLAALLWALADTWLQPWTHLSDAPVWRSFTGLMLGYACLLPLYLIRGCSAGDVKLMGMIGACLGPTPMVAITLYTLLAGGVMSLLALLKPGVARKTLENMGAIVRSGEFMRLNARAQDDSSIKTAYRLPYACAIATGLLYWWATKH